jgi:uncharacterized membrane protein
VAALANEQFPILFQDGRSARVALYALLNVSTGDTADLSALFSSVKRAVILGTTLQGAALVSTISGTTITIPAGTNDAGVLLAYGVAR